MEYRITISPDPTRIVNKAQKRSYIACTSREQYCILVSRIKDAIEETIKEYHYDIEIQTKMYIEMNAMGCLHTHGTIMCTGRVDNNFKIMFQRMILRVLGREFLKGNPATYLNAVCDMVDVNIQWQKIEGSNYNSWYEYCLKDQTESHLKRFPPIELRSNSLEYLESLLTMELLGTKEGKAIEKRIENLKKTYRNVNFTV